MSEPKIRYRVPPCAAYDIPGMESWLEDMAAKGLHLCPDGFLWGLASFEVGQPRTERFRLEATATNGALLSDTYAPDQKAQDLHAELGWTYRARRGQFHIYSTADPHAPELNTDPQVQAMTMAALVKFLRGRIWNLFFWVFLYFGIRCYDALVTFTVAFDAVPMVVFLLLMLWPMWRDLRDIVQVRRLQKLLENGAPLPHRNDYRAKTVPYLGGKVLRFCLWCFVVCTIFWVGDRELYDIHAIALEDYDKPFPFATVADFYPEGEARREDAYIHNDVLAWSNFFAPENYEFSEYCAVKLPDDQFDVTISVRYHRLRYRWAAELLARELVSQAGGSPIHQFFDELFHTDPVYPEVLHLPDCDYAVYYYRLLHYPYLVLQKDNVVIKVHFYEMNPWHPIPIEEVAQIALSHLE